MQTSDFWSEWRERPRRDIGKQERWISVHHCFLHSFQASQSGDPGPNFLMIFTRDCGAEMKLYKLSVYGSGLHPRGCVNGWVAGHRPAHSTRGWWYCAEVEWPIDFADKFAAATEPSICFIAFFGDVEHEVLLVTSGYRAMLTYYKTPHATSSHFASPVHQRLKEALVELVDDKIQLPNGGYLEFGLQH
ncbi:hypothetical protein PAXRUDRAFT_788435 [Paxillus rubicundulus Ve08.2h10]|uniref:Prolyl 4-hydroxylase alpha subunit Fe(2+) 2OG dioxygenase domain-containing protein n=1 Tax=Paxillus rubicundulus Ve08.2h10 TaxID=930991 RepID=A0A0D0D8U0_9AGAM|nr:hypothetical protein PAXRUDRAFT_788435 [Paxillus rubicundulus Ve08.2h10]